MAHALHTLLPQEQLVYFGDTAHLPYGDKSKETIVRYALRITDFLIAQKCKMILIACNSASSNAFEEVKNHVKDKVGDRAVVMNVIDPVVDQVCADTEGVDTVGVIGTKATVSTGIYAAKINQQAPGLQVTSLATPLLVPMIEEGFVFDDISNAIIRAYLSRKELEGINSLILGCTHYPIIRNQISRFFDFEVNVPDTSQVVARAVKKNLETDGMLNPARKEENRFFVSDHTSYFEAIANMFFNEKINLEKKNIWQ